MAPSTRASGARTIATGRESTLECTGSGVAAGHGEQESSHCRFPRSFFSSPCGGGCRYVHKGQPRYTYQGEWAEGLRHGLGKLEFDGVSFEGKFERSRPLPGPHSTHAASHAAPCIARCPCWHRTLPLLHRTLLLLHHPPLFPPCCAFILFHLLSFTLFSQIFFCPPSPRPPLFPLQEETLCMPTAPACPSRSTRSSTASLGPSPIPRHGRRCCTSSRSISRTPRPPAQAYVPEGKIKKEDKQKRKKKKESLRWGEVFLGGFFCLFSRAPPSDWFSVFWFLCFPRGFCLFFYFLFLKFTSP
jgi:hypothetical protein